MIFMQKVDLPSREQEKKKKKNENEEKVKLAIWARLLRATTRKQQRHKGQI